MITAEETSTFAITKEAADEKWHPTTEAGDGGVEGTLGQFGANYDQTVLRFRRGCE